MADLIQLRRDTAANWTSANPTLSQGEQGYETDTGKMKIGDGSTAWTSLAYFVDSSAYATSSDITSAVSTKANTADLATVATSGSYNDLSDQPSIPSITGLATETYVDTAVSNLVDTAPAALDTLNELAAALGDDADFAGTVTTSLAAKANTADLATVATTGAYSDLTGTPTIPADVSDLTDTTSLLGGGGGGGGSFEAVASGSLSDGSTVVLNADGTVSVVQEVGDPVGPTAEVTFSSSAVSYPAAVFDPNANKVIICYQDGGNSSYGAAIVGTISGDTITFGSPVVYVSAYVLWQRITFDTVNNKVVINFVQGSGGTHFIVGGYSGDSLTFGTKVAATADAQDSTSNQDIGFDPNSGKVLHVFQQDVSPQYYGMAQVGTVSGYSISFGSTRTFWTTGYVYSPKVVAAPGTGKVVVIWNSGQSGNTSRYGRAIVGTISGTSISFGVANTFSANKTYSINGTFDTNSNKIVVSYTNNDLTPRQGYVKVGTISGTSISFGTATSLGTEPSDWITFDSNQNKVVIAVDNQLLLGTVSGTSISLSSEANWTSSSSPVYFDGIVFDSNANRAVIIDGLGASGGIAVVYRTAPGAAVTNLTAENYAGIADAAYSDAATATIQTAGSVDDAQSGLTPGQAYYVQPNGTLGITPGTPSVFAGTAVSSTKLLIGKEAPAATVAYADVTGTPDLSSYATETYVTTTVNNLVDTAPEALNTLNELAAALGDDADFAGTVTTSLAAKANTADLATVATTGAYSDLTGTPTVPADVSDLTDTTSLIGGGGGSFEAVASGTLANGDIVIVNADGTVSVVAEVGVTEGFGDLSSNYASGAGFSDTYVVSTLGGKIVAVYRDTANLEYGTAVVGTISGKSISFGTPVVFNAGSTNMHTVAEIKSTNKIAIFWQDTPGRHAIVGSVSGSSISFGTKTTISTQYAYAVTAWHDPISDRIGLFYRNGGAYGEVYSVSGTSITRVSTVTINSQGDYSDYTNSIYDTHMNKYIVWYMYRSYTPTDTFTTRYKIVTISGNSMSVGSEQDWGTARFGHPVFGAASNNRTIFAWCNSSTSGGAGNSYLQLRIGYASGSSVSSGSTYTVSSAQTNTDPRISYDPVNNQGIIFWSQYDGSSWTGRYRTFTLTGDTTASFGSTTLNPAGGSTWSQGDLNHFYDATLGRIVISFRTNAQIYQTADVTETNLTAENYIGISDGAYSNGANATVQIVGSVDDAQSGLTPGQKYYVQTDGTLSATADDPSVFAGTAVSTTKLIVKG